MATKDSTPSRIIEYVDTLKIGSTFICGDLSDYGDYSSVRSALARLCAKGDIKRLCQGVYIKPGNPDDSIDYCNVAKEIARKTGASVLFKDERVAKSTRIFSFYTNSSTRSAILDDGTIIKFIHSNKINK
jgi:protein involved in ribonucleotide reduction